jgi:IPT/TIG domain
MNRKLVTAAVAKATLSLGLVGLVGLAGSAAAAPTPVHLNLDQGTAFSILGASCGGIQEQSFATGFDPTTGYPVGVVDMSTSCSSGGRGSHPHLYTATADVTWDFTASVVSATAPATRTVDPAFSATDANGNQIYNQANAAYLLLAPGFTPTPRVTRISASIGPASGGTSVVISGTGFTGATHVDFGTTPAASFTITDDRSITAVAPVAPAGQVDVKVTSAGGTDATGAFDVFTFVAAPVITSLSPNSGPLQGGNQVVISGTGLAPVISVYFGGNYAFVTAQSDTSITVTAPAGEGVDNEMVTVSSIGGTASASYAYTAPDLCGSGCVFTSPGTASATTGVPFSFTVSATGGVTPTFTEKGRLPHGVTFVNNYDGTATLSGKPVNGPLRLAAGSYPLKIKATFSYGTATKTVAQYFTLTVS